MHGSARWWGWCCRCGTLVQLGWRSVVIALCYEFFDSVEPAEFVGDLDLVVVVVVIIVCAAKLRRRAQLVERSRQFLIGPPKLVSALLQLIGRDAQLLHSRVRLLERCAEFLGNYRCLVIERSPELVEQHRDLIIRSELERFIRRPRGQHLRRILRAIAEHLQRHKFAVSQP